MTHGCSNRLLNARYCQQTRNRVVDSADKTFRKRQTQYCRAGAECMAKWHRLYAELLSGLFIAQQ